MARTPKDSLNHYYLHGYQLINPICRIVRSTPTIRVDMDRGGKNLPDVVVNFLVRQILEQHNLSMNDNAVKLLGDSDDVRAAVTGDASLQARAFKAALDQFNPQESAKHTVQSLKKPELNRVCREIFGKMEEAWTDAKNIKLALRAVPRIKLTEVGRSRQAYLIRGDTNSMINFLANNVPRFRRAVAGRCAIAMHTEWTTNQPFSTSSGNGLASVAGHALIWLIRVDPDRTSGRAGGLYIGEAEILFPHGVVFSIEGMVAVSSITDIDDVNLVQFSYNQQLREKIRSVYTANNLNGKKVCFLVASEAWELPF